MARSGRRLRILTWNVHANYLNALCRVPHDWLLVRGPHERAGSGGRGNAFDWPDNVHDLDHTKVRNTAFDGVLYQHRSHWEVERIMLLTDAQQSLPAIYLEHDPPQQHPSDALHCTNGLVQTLVQVTAFNALMWDSGKTPTRVIEHSVFMPSKLVCDGSLARGLVVINHLRRRGRRLGSDIYLSMQSRLPLDLAGMDSALLPGGIGQIPNRELPARMCGYRFLFSPIRWTSLSLAVIEAMSVGLPIVGLATTELPTVIRNGENGWLETDPEELLPVMQELLAKPALAKLWGERARELARERFGIRRFVDDWQQLLSEVIG